ncbi:MAG: hypothetical protein KDE63_03555 [Novosphingobium sp.]|nr:hypothetical protein [Novosphingobium sp.]
MTIRFAAARNRDLTFASRFFLHGAIYHAANDNGESIHGSALLEEALRHFGQYGLGAARAAHAKARQAFFDGDRASYDKWREICRLFDRRIAREIPAEPESRPQLG